MSISKAIREQVYNKHNGHCAYCGQTIAIKDMQVDHIDPQRRYGDKNVADRTENLNPSCRRCNHYKRANGLETFRRYLLDMEKKVLGTYLGKVAQDYSMVNWTGWDGKFYFEKNKAKL